VENQYETIFTGLDRINNESVNTNRFEIIYFGNMSKFQSPEPVLKAINSLPPDKKFRIKIIFVGNVFSGFNEQIKAFPHIKIETRDYLPRDEMMKAGKSASLLLIINPSAVYGKGVISAKIFDYLSLRKPILAIGEKGGSLADLLVQTESGQLFSYKDIGDISLFINKYLDIWIKESNILLEDSSNLDRYRTQNNVKKLTQIFEKLL
jgi:hypothetical protein